MLFFHVLSQVNIRLIFLTTHLIREVNFCVFVFYVSFKANVTSKNLATLIAGIFLKSQNNAAHNSPSESGPRPPLPH